MSVPVLPSRALMVPWRASSWKSSQSSPRNRTMSNPPGVESGLTYVVKAKDLRSPRPREPQWPLTPAMKAQPMPQFPCWSSHALLRLKLYLEFLTFLLGPLMLPLILVN